MKKFMLNIQLEGLDNETRMKLLPREQKLVKELVFFFFDRDVATKENNIIFKNRLIC